MKILLENLFRSNKHLMVLVDAIIVALIFFAAVFLRAAVSSGGTAVVESGTFLILASVVVLSHLTSFYIFSLYSIEIKRSDSNLIILISLSAVLAVGLITLASFFFPEARPGRLLISFHTPLLVIAVFLWRKLFFSLITKIRKSNLLLFASPDSIEKFQNLIDRYPTIDYKLCCAISDYLDNPGFIDAQGIAYSADLEVLVKEKDIKTIVVSENFKKVTALKQHLMNLKYKGFEIYDFSTFYEKTAARVPLFQVDDEDIIFSYQDKSFNPPLYLKLKRFLDITCALGGLVLSAPLWPIIALMIKLDARGPVLFKQERLGMNEKPFTLLKFRTMVVDAEKETGPRWSSVQDPRITRVGRFLRRKRLDEIPQLLNILKGEMSFVGPRPIRKYFADTLSKEIPYYRFRFTVKPGVSGWAQVMGDYAGSKKGQLEKFEYELYYIQNRSIFMDAFIFLKTIQTVLLKRGE